MRRLPSLAIARLYFFNVAFSPTVKAKIAFIVLACYFL